MLVKLFLLVLLVLIVAVVIFDSRGGHLGLSQQPAGAIAGRQHGSCGRVGLVVEGRLPEGLAAVVVIRGSCRQNTAVGGDIIYIFYI